MNEKSEVGSEQDLEKLASISPRSTPDMAERYNPYMGRSPYDQASISSDDDNLVDQRMHLESKAPNILVRSTAIFPSHFIVLTYNLQLFLSGPCVLLSALLCIWSLVISLFTVLTYPLRLFSASRQPLSDELRSLLARSNRLQLRAIYSFSPLRGKSVASLLLVHLASPFLAMAIALGAWAVAIYWLFAAMIGDPDGTEGGNDGRATVLGLRAYWEMWLCKAMEP